MDNFICLLTNCMSSLGIWLSIYSNFDASFVVVVFFFFLPFLRYDDLQHCQLYFYKHIIPTLHPWLESPLTTIRSQEPFQSYLRDKFSSMDNKFSSNDLEPLYHLYLLLCFFFIADMGKTLIFLLFSCGDADPYFLLFSCRDGDIYTHIGK